MFFIRLYHLSKTKDLTILEPKVPECAVPMFENTTTKRVCFSDNIEGCLSALQDGPSVYYVYILNEHIEESFLYYPSVNEAIDCKLTNEIWIKKKIHVKCIGIIQTQNYDWSKRHNTGIGKRATFFHYSYEWIEKFDL